MATLSRGKTFTATEQVTNTKLHQLVDNATISNIQAADMAAGTGFLVTAASAPSDTNVLWYDSVNAVLKKYIGSSWIEIPTIASPSSGQSILYNGTHWVGTAAGSPYSFKNLKVVYTSATQITITADGVALNDGTWITAVSQVNAITTTGASGLMTGLTEGNKWYYAWIIRKSSDGTVSSILTESSTTIATLPAGYDQYALVSAVHNTAGNFVNFTQVGRDYYYAVPVTAASGTITSWQTVDITEFVPAGISTFAFGTFVNTESYSAIGWVSNVGSDTANKIGQSLQWSNSGFGANLWAFPWQLPILTANTLYFYASGGSNYLYIAGFILNKLG